MIKQLIIKLRIFSRMQHGMMPQSDSRFVVDVKRSPIGILTLFPTLWQKKSIRLNLFRIIFIKEKSLARL
jgi:hypothetical protein